MAHPLLVLSPQTAFGNLIAQALPDYQVHLTSDFSEAIQFVSKNNPTPPVLLDADLDEIDISVLDIGLALRQIRPDVNLILIAREGQSTIRLRDLPLRAILVKPLSLPDLQSVLKKLETSQFAVAPSPTIPPLPATELEWLRDVSRAARHLTRLMLESSAQAALITRQNELWAYAGQLKREAAQELARSVQKYWDTQSQTDLLRFIRLEATEAQHMLYARRLTASMVLALVFDAETPFSTIRAQAGQLVRSLAEVPHDQTSQVTLTEDTGDLTDGEDLDNLPPIADLLGEVPPPLPPKQDRRNRVAMPWEQKPTPQVQTAQPPQPVDPPLVTTHPMFSPDFSRESSPAVRRREERPALPSLDQTRLGRVQREQRIVPEELEATRVQKASSDPNSLIETRPQSVTEVAHRIVLEPASPAMYNLNYACLLVPRFDSHHLTGDMADQLSDWVAQVCIAFGWRLEHISVRPEYLQWVVSVPPATAPGYIMRIVRQQTSERVFKEYPRIKNDNPSGDFWAPGYLIMGGSQPHPQKLVRDFIEQTRQRQGLRRDK
ncbi:MAG TPA: IS200/IS605 family transposase [Anaerolineae bacterium]|jgi:REP element-mobilizing transposase RayT/CheY-like chemotaxis protein|nr:IS200/IS605 family transposase [Anaerolineae bacterium]